MLVVDIDRSRTISGCYNILQSRLDQLPLHYIHNQVCQSTHQSTTYNNLASRTNILLTRNERFRMSGMAELSIFRDTMIGIDVIVLTMEVDTLMK
jgi:hypothetical protein